MLTISQHVSSAPQGEDVPVGQLFTEDQALAKRATELEYWGGNVENNAAAWHKAKPTKFFSSADSAKKEAKEGYEYVMSKTPKKKRKYQQLVAALWIADGPGRGVYLSSIPKDAATKMDKGEAPAWAHQVTNRKGEYHAEDGAMWLFESKLSTKLGAQDDYPHGSIMYVYGHFEWDDDDEPKNVGYKSPCSIGALVDPSCNNVLRNLGITIANS